MAVDLSIGAAIACCIILYALGRTTLSWEARILAPLCWLPVLLTYIDPATYPACVAVGHGITVFYAHWVAGLALFPVLGAGEDAARLLWTSLHAGRSPERKARYWARQRVWLRWFLDGLALFGWYHYVLLCIAVPATATPLAFCWLLASYRAYALVLVLLPETQLPK